MQKNKGKRRLWKIVCILCVLSFCFCFYACQRKVYTDISEAISDGGRMGENVYIDGIDVSGMAIDDAQKALSENHVKELSGLNIILANGDKNIEIKGSALPITYNADDVLLEAVNLSPYCPSNNGKRQLKTDKMLDVKKTESVLETLTEPLNSAAENASAKYDAKAEGKFIYTDECGGECVDCADAANKISECLQNGNRKIEISTIKTEPQYTKADAQRDNSLIGEFTTSFDGETYSKPGRTFNIKKAASMIDGTVLKKDEEFDMNKILGDRNAENGWEKAAGIRDGKYVQEYGGGVCQVSSTLYNAVLMSNLEITERHHHSWPLGYIPIARDATISTGGPNFKFKNNTESAITVSCEVNDEKKTVTARIYGRKNSDFASITVTSQKTGELEDLGNEIILDETLSAGSEEVERESRKGVVAECYKEFKDEEGNTIKKELVSRDKYRSVKGIIRVAPDVYSKYEAQETLGSAIFFEDSEYDWTEYFDKYEE